MINVTKTLLPPLDEYVKYLEKIWESGKVTNNGDLVRELEAKLKNILQVKHLFFTTNGTIALQLALRSLGLKRKIITTPFSYVATLNSVLWEHCEPQFVDIDPIDLCIDPELIERAIDSDTEAILAVHVYGNPCNVERLKEIADKNGLKLIYDAAHAFGSRIGTRPLASFGDISTLSFHATKIFHTVEGGAVVTDDDDVAEKIRLMRSFGHFDHDYKMIGINGKNTEFHAAMGLCLLPRINEVIERRQELSLCYENNLTHPSLTRPFSKIEGNKYNFAYYPVIFSKENDLSLCISQLASKDIFPRRYFYPSLTKMPFVNTASCKVSESIAPRILCLPLGHDVNKEIQDLITDIILQVLG